MDGKLDDAKKIMIDNQIDVFDDQNCYYMWPREYHMLYKWCNDNKYIIYNHYFFIEACRDGNIQEVQKMVTTYGNKYVSKYNECAFYISCYNGHLNIAQYLLDVKPDIYISNCSFKWACINGHIETAKWLHGMNPNMIISNETFTFTICNIQYSYKQSEVAKWLLQLKPVIYDKFQYNNIMKWLKARNLLHALHGLTNIIVIP